MATPNLCGPNSNCTNKNVSYSCSCWSGYHATNANHPISDINQCIDIDECIQTPSVCGPNSVCNNTIGDYNCTCLSGYNVTDPSVRNSAHNPCTDVDECLQSSSICGPKSVCNNTVGGYNCTCQSGYQVINTSLLSSVDNPCTELLYYKVEFELNGTSGIVDQLRNILNGLSLSDNLSEITDTYITTGLIILNNMYLT
ncbi:adhesion G protein-coupled receptor E2-like [Sardina pilchardus]|uniref:adhesion G protein-coupled receptor E2-like n=1 Tax=Sardina pilchardus TaxID=27697 RepID=UPI002E11347F